MTASGPPPEQPRSVMNSRRLIEPPGVNVYRPDKAYHLATEPRMRRGKQSEPILRPNVRLGSKGEMLAASRCFPLFTQQRTSLKRVGMSVRCPTAEVTAFCSGAVPSLLNLREVPVTHTSGLGGRGGSDDEASNNHWVRGCRSAHGRRNRRRHEVTLALDRRHDFIERPPS